MIWAGFVMGLAGSLHCAGMCGPLAILIHGGAKNAISLRGLLYHLGRITTYLFIGFLVGSFSKILAVYNFQRGAAIVIGIGLILFLISQSRLNQNFSNAITRITNRMKQKLSKLLGKRTLASGYLFGLLNGWLPCGLVYLAAVSSFTMLSIQESVLFMLAFGVGTIPLLLMVTVLGVKIGQLLPFKVSYLYTGLILLTSFLFLLRGFNTSVIDQLSTEGITKAVITACGF